MRVRYMNKKRNNLGFTLAELLIVVAIITVLGGLAMLRVLRSGNYTLLRGEENV